MIIYNDVTVGNSYHAFYLKIIETGDEYLTYEQWLASVGAELLIGMDCYLKSYYTLVFRNPEDEIAFRLKYVTQSL